MAQPINDSSAKTRRLKDSFKRAAKFFLKTEAKILGLGSAIGFINSGPQGIPRGAMAVVHGETHIPAFFSHFAQDINDAAAAATTPLGEAGNVSLAALRELTHPLVQMSGTVGRSPAVTYVFETLHMSGIAADYPGFIGIGVVNLALLGSRIAAKKIPALSNHALRRNNKKKISSRRIKMLAASTTALAAISFTGYTVAEASLPSTNDSLIISLTSPQRGALATQSFVTSDEYPLGARPDLVQLDTNSSDVAQHEMIAAVKAQIIKNGGPLYVLDVGGDGYTNSMGLPEPSADGTGGTLPDTPPNARYGTIYITDFLQAMVSLQQQEFSGHKAGEPLAKTFIVTGCDVFMSEDPDTARKLFSLSNQLNMQVMASGTEVESDSIQNYGHYAVIRPDGTWSPLPGPSRDTGENAAKNEAWLDNFPEKDITEPRLNDPFSIASLPIPPSLPQFGQAPPNHGAGTGNGHHGGGSNQGGHSSNGVGHQGGQHTNAPPVRPPCSPKLS